MFMVQKQSNATWESFRIKATERVNSHQHHRLVLRPKTEALRVITQLALPVQAELPSTALLPPGGDPAPEAAASGPECIEKSSRLLLSLQSHQPKKQQ